VHSSILISVGVKLELGVSVAVVPVIIVPVVNTIAEAVEVIITTTTRVPDVVRCGSIIPLVSLEASKTLVLARGLITGVSVLVSAGSVILIPGPGASPPVVGLDGCWVVGVELSNGGIGVGISSWSGSVT